MRKRMLLRKVALIFVVSCIKQIDGHDNCTERIHNANGSEEWAKIAVLHCLCVEGNLQNDVCRTEVERFMNSSMEISKDDCYRKGAILGGICVSTTILGLCIIVWVIYKKRYDIENFMMGFPVDHPILSCAFCNDDHADGRNEIIETYGLFEVVTEIVRVMLAQVMDEMNRKRIIYVLPEKESVDEQAKELR